LPPWESQAWAADEPDWRAGGPEQALPALSSLTAGAIEHGFEAAENFIDPSELARLNEPALSPMRPVAAPALADAEAPTEGTADPLLPPRIRTRPPQLEQAVNKAIAEHGFRSTLRHALNRGYGLKLEPPHEHWDPAREEHRALMNDLRSSSKWTATECSRAAKFLVLVERKGMVFTRDASNDDRQGFERLVNQHGELAHLRQTLNKIFNLELKAPVHDTSQPTLQEHLELMKGLREKLSPYLCKAVSKFFCHLEHENKSWSTVTVGVEALQDTVNDAVARGQIDPATPRALNKAFGLALTKPKACAREPVLPEHLHLLAALPADLKTIYRSCVSHLLAYLESKGKSWRELAPDPTSPVQPQLEECINDAMARGQLRTETRTALASAYGFRLRSKSGRAKVSPVFPEHILLLKRLPADLSPSMRSNVNRFLCHQEVIGTCWSALVKEAADQDPAG
jgi:hypothetical protein